VEAVAPTGPAARAKKTTAKKAVPATAPAKAAAPAETAEPTKAAPAGEGQAADKQSNTEGAE
jgi:hypothetical protein